MVRKKKYVKRKKRRTSFKIPYSFIATFVLSVCVVFLVFIDYKQRSENSPLKKVIQERFKGSEDAELNIIAYIDYLSTDSDQGYVLLQDYMRKYPGKISLQMRYFPSAELHNSLVSSIYAECSARQSRFWEVTDLLFKRQSQWGKLSKPQIVFNKIMDDADLDYDRLDVCVSDKSVANDVLAEKAVAEGYFVKSAPTFFLNNQMVVGSYYLHEQLQIYFKEQRPDVNRKKNIKWKIK